MNKASKNIVHLAFGAQKLSLPSGAHPGVVPDLLDVLFENPPR